jgi:uncharacterized protein (DUF1330 family)
MAAFVIVDVDISDPVTYEEYKNSVKPSLDAYGASFLARGGKAVTLEGDWRPGRIVILRFEDLDTAKRWWASEEYAAPKALRQSASTARMIAVEGI